MTKLRRTATFDPRDLATKATGPLAFLHPSTRVYRPSMRTRAIQTQLTWTGFGIVAAVLSWVATHTLGPAIILMVAIPVLWGFVCIGAYRAWRGLLADTRTIHDLCWGDAKGEAYALVRGFDYDRGFAKLREGLNAVLYEHGSDAEAVKARLILRLATIQSVRAGVVGLVGNGGVPQTEKARLAAIRSAMDDATAELKLARAASVESLSRSFEDAGRIGAAPPSPAASLTGNARINRLVANAETALEIDPDLVDAGGARIDSLVREHLPRLISRHAELSLITPLDGIDEADVNLEKGVELVRASVAEAIAGLRGSRADALRTEIAFLRMRRNAAA